MGLVHADAAPAAQGDGPVHPVLRVSSDSRVKELINVHKHFECEPTERRVTAIGRFSVKPYKQRWGSVKKACEAAYKKFGEP